MSRYLLLEIRRDIFKSQTIQKYTINITTVEFLNLSVVHVLLTHVMISSELTVSPSYSSFLVLENLLQVVLDFSPLFSE